MNALPERRAAPAQGIGAAAGASLALIGLSLVGGLDSRAGLRFIRQKAMIRARHRDGQRGDVNVGGGACGGLACRKSERWDGTNRRENGSPSPQRKKLLDYWGTGMPGMPGAKPTYLPPKRPNKTAIMGRESREAAVLLGPRNAKNPSPCRLSRWPVAAGQRTRRLRSREKTGFMGKILGPNGSAGRRADIVTDHTADHARSRRSTA